MMTHLVVGEVVVVADVVHGVVVLVVVVADILMRYVAIRCDVG